MADLLFYWIGFNQNSVSVDIFSTTKQPNPKPENRGQPYSE